jgi:hypothetical protein
VEWQGSGKQNHTNLILLKIDAVKISSVDEKRPAARNRQTSWFAFTVARDLMCLA